MLAGGKGFLRTGERADEVGGSWVHVRRKWKRSGWRN